MKNFSSNFFLVAFAVFLLLLIATYICAGAADEGTANPNKFVNGMFYFFSFPFNILMKEQFSNSLMSYMGGMFLNVVFYTLASERIYSFIKHRRSSGKQNEAKEKDTV